MQKQLPSVTVIIPAYNEEESIGAIVSHIKTKFPDFDILVVNDGSTDQTARVAVQAGARVYPHPYNIGNGAAVKSGIRNAHSDVLVFMDADSQHDPEDISKLLAHIENYDMVVGARQMFQQASIFRAFGNKAYNFMASYVANFRIKDLTSGFRAVKTDIAKKFVYLLPNTYSYPSTLTLGILRTGRSLKYVPIQVGKRKTGKSRIRLVKDGVRFFMIITKICTLYSPLRVFLPVSAVMFLLGMANYAYTYFSQGRFTNMSALMFITSVLVFMLGLISDQICQMRVERSEGELDREKYQ